MTSLSFINDEAFKSKGFHISTDKDLLNFESIYSYLNNDSYWAKGIAAEQLRRAIDNAMCFGIYGADGFAGFARVITDQATFAYICDVFVLPQYRELGLSKWLVQTIINHPALQGLRRWSLATADAHSLYKQFGFRPLSKPENWMEIFKPYQSILK